MDFDLKKKVVLIVSIAIAVIIVSGTLIPVIAESTSETLTQRNTGSYFALTNGDDTDTHVITIASNASGFSIKTDGNSVTVPSMGSYNPGGSAVADYIAIGVYEGYTNDSGVLTSQSGVTPTASQTIATFRDQALAGNTGVTNGTYQLWNFYQYTLIDKIMGYTVLGNTDSQYMMGPGKSAGSGPNDTGLTSTPYATSATSADSVALFIENGYGSVWEFVGDTQIINYDLQAGNALGGNSLGSVENTLTTVATIPAGASKNFIESVYLSSDVFGVPKTVGGTSPGTSGEGINDAMWSNSGSRLLRAGGDWDYGSADGLSAWASSRAFGSSNAAVGSRLAYVVTGAGDAPAANYGYVVTFNADGTQIEDVQALVDGTLTSVMPTGTALNSFWDFDTTTGVGPFGSYYVAINLNGGANADDDTEARLSTVKGEVAYILNPANLKQTLAGNEFTQGEYNVMLMIPTVYWGFDESAGKLYIGSSADRFSGQTLVPYAHTYTIDPDVNTGNPGSTASASLAMGSNAILRLYATGDLRLITNNATVDLGQASGDAILTVSITGDVLTYTTAAGNTGTISGILAYISSAGEMTLTRNPYVTEDSEVIIGGYANNLETTEGGLVDIGYCASGTVEELTISSLVNPVSKDGNTAGSTEITKNLSDVTTTDLKKVDSILFTTSWATADSADAGTSTATYTYFLAPAEVEYENPNEILSDGPVKAMLTVIPILVIMGIVLGTFVLIRMRD